MSSLPCDMTLAVDARIPEPGPLEQALEAAVGRYPTELLLTPDTALIRNEAQALVQAVTLAMVGDVPTWPGPPPLNRLHLLRMLRREVLRAWPESEGNDLLQTMRAFETVEASLDGTDDGSGSPDAVRPFARSLLREVAHALLSPLGSIVMLAETLREDPSGPLSEAQHRRLNIIHRAAASGASISNDLLTLTSPRQHYGGITRFVVGDAVEAIADLVRPVTEARNSELVVDQRVAGARSGPRSGVTQAFLGLALRAALMTKDGTIELRTEPGGDDLVTFSLAVRGGSSGAPDPEDTFRVFRTESGAEGYTLSPEGLAFSAAREIVEAMGSTLEIEANEIGNFEVRFAVRLPEHD